MHSFTLRMELVVVARRRVTAMACRTSDRLVSRASLPLLSRTLQDPCSIRTFRATPCRTTPGFSGPLPEAWPRPTPRPSRSLTITRWLASADRCAHLKIPSIAEGSGSQLGRAQWVGRHGEDANDYPFSDEKNSAMWARRH